jgi:hypothetical protein
MKIKLDRISEELIENEYWTREEAEEYAEKEKHKNGRVDTTDDTKKCDFLNGHNSGGL